jgi:hypothetical protein
LEKLEAYYKLFLNNCTFATLVNEHSVDRIKRHLKLTLQLTPIAFD